MLVAEEILLKWVRGQEEVQYKWKFMCLNMKTVTENACWVAAEAHFSISEVPQTTPYQQQDAYLKFGNPCNPETTHKTKNVRSAQHSPNRHRQICSAQKIPLFSRVQLEEIVACITQAYIWSIHLSVRDLISRLSPPHTSFSGELQAGLKNRNGEWSTSPTTELPERSWQFHATGRKPHEKITQPSGWATW